VVEAQAAQEKDAQAHQERLEAIASTAPARKLHVRFSDGTEVTAEGSIFHEQPELARNLLDRALDPGRDGILAYKIGDVDEANSLLARLVILVPKAKGEYVENDGLLFLTSDEQPAIRKAAAFMRKLGHYDVEVAGEQHDHDADDDGADVEVEEAVEADPQPMIPPAEDPKAVNF
jgi:DNA-binding LacI/PurR family transcriptional regulator